MVQKGFKVLEVGNDEKFLDINIQKVEYDAEHIFLRANAIGKPIYINGKIKIDGKQYIPEK